MSKDLSGRMKDDWNARGLDDPLYWTVSAPVGGPGSWDVDAYFDSGERCIRSLVDQFITVSETFSRAFEIGCGAGRCTQALALRFPWVCGLDVSSVMLREAKRLAAERGPQNITWIEGDGTGARIEGMESQFGFVFSTLALAHIPDPAIQCQYITDMGWLLRPGGKFIITLYDDAPGYGRTVKKWEDRRQGGAIGSGWQQWAMQELPRYETFIRTPIPHDMLEAAMDAGGLQWATVGGEGTDLWVIAGDKLDPADLYLEGKQEHDQTVGG